MERAKLNSFFTKPSIVIDVIGNYTLKNQDFNPDYAIAEFAEDARRQGRRRTKVLQALANAADSVKSTIPKGDKF